MAVLGTPLLWASAALMFAYVSTEVALSGWLPVLLNRSAALPLAAGAMVASWFWFLITIVRFVAAWFSRFLTPMQMLWACVVFSIAGGVLMVVSTLLGSQIVGLAATAVFGLAMGPILPSTLSILRHSFASEQGIVTGVAMGAGSIGGAAVPWALGAVVVNQGPLAGAGILLALTFAMALMLAVIDTQARVSTPKKSRYQTVGSNT